MTMEFYLISYIVVIAAVSGIIAKVLHQPLIIGYLVSGIIIAFFGFVPDPSSLNSLAQIGVTLLLFLLGIEMNLKELPIIGKVALVTGLGQIVFTSAIGFLISKVLGYGTLTAVYISVALTFSSTIIMVKLLSEKNELSSLYGKISVGFLLVQDFVAVLILMFLSSLGKGGMGANQYVFVAVKAILLLVTVWFLSKKILPFIFEKILSSSTELLFIGSIAWALGVASFVAGPMGFTLEIGGFLAGIALSSLPEHLQIASRAKPLRDFFLVIFFLLLGTQLVIGRELIVLLPKALILSLFVLIGNPIIILILLGSMGYKKRTSFMAGLTVAQISEFSFILMSMGQSLGQVGAEDVSLVVIVGVITMTLSTYLIMGSDKVFAKIHKYLSVFERKRTKESAFIAKTSLLNHIVLVGADRAGGRLAKYFRRKKIDFVIVDFNPSVFNNMTAEGMPIVFGDINDPEISDASNIQHAHLVISTTNSLSANVVLLDRLKKLESKSASIFTASRISDAVRLYELGATYVMVPDILAGDNIRHLISLYKDNVTKLKKAGKINFNNLIYSFYS